MKKTLLTLSVLAASAAHATPFTGNDAKSNAMGNTGVASAASFSMGQMNPALLAAKVDQPRFSILLPAAKFAIDDSYGFLKTSEVVENFDDVDTAAIQLEVNGLPDAVNDVALASAEFESATDQASLQAAAANLSSSNTALNNKVISIRAEVQLLENAITDTNKSLSELEDKPLSIMTSLSGAFAMPRDTISFAFHLSNDTTVGMRAQVSQNDQNTISGAVSDTTGYLDEVQQITSASTEVSNKASALAELSVDFSSSAYINALNELTAATAKLEAERSGTTVSYNTYNADGDNNADNTVNANPTDSNTLDNYTSTNGFYQNGEFDSNSTAVQTFGDDSTITIVGANIVEFGVSIAQNFEYAGETIALGVTPKLQSITVFEDTVTFTGAGDEIGDDPEAYFSSNTESYFTGNIDLGAAMTWDNVLRGDVTAGVAIKDLIPQSFETANGSELEVGPKLRIGGSHTTRWVTLAADLDITENQPLRFGAPTRYLGLGAEFNAYNWFKFRAGYRNNLSIENSHVISSGFGLTPWGVGVDLSVWAKPAFDDGLEAIQDAGAVAQFSVEF